ncbi:MAG: shikimate dehydrogenase [Robiginitomaculum sp.]|nr:MAG: shikimate dehydrogenase [Robiginitomaculum sp.]
MSPRLIPKVAGVCGWPIHHSMSPTLHNFWLKELGVNGTYAMFAMHPDEAVRAFRSLKQTTIVGVNVTIPLKGKAFEAADELTPDAQKLGVCNLLYTRDNRLIGHNTDMEGFSEPLLRRVGQNFIRKSTVVVIGAGGASRAVLGALMAIGAPEIRLINRTDARAESVANHINNPSLRAFPWAERDHAIYGADLVINASAAGMHGNTSLDIDVSYVTPGGWVYDLVYTPQDTDLLVQARQQGLNTIGGLEMLIAQARPSFRLLYGVSPPLDGAVKGVLERHLAGST